MTTTPLLLTMKPDTAISAPALADTLARARRIAVAAGLKPQCLPAVHCLAELDRHPDGLAMREVAAAMAHTTAAATCIVDTLENKGLCERRHDPADRRQIRVNITLAGKFALAIP